jgi:hypothetical protein
MPELPVKETRFSDLHLPEIKRDDIVSSLSEMHLPDIDLTRLERPKLDLPDAVSNFEWPRISSSDVGKAMAGAAAAVHIGRRTRRPTWLLAVGGLIVAAIVAAVILTNETVRARLASGAHAVTERIAAMRPGDHEGLEIDHDEAIAFDAAETKPIEALPFSETSTIDATRYPDGLGMDHDGATPALEEATSRE